MNRRGFLKFTLASLGALVVPKVPPTLSNAHREPAGYISYWAQRVNPDGTTENISVHRQPYYGDGETIYLDAGQLDEIDE